MRGCLRSSELLGWSMADLREVRRYWPKAKMSGQLLADGAAVWTVYVSDSSRRLRIVVYADGTAAAGMGLLPIQSQPTIHEAMRAAGFGRKPEYAMKGHHFAADRRRIEGGRLALRSWRAGVGRMPPWLVRATEPFNRLPALTINHRHRKGARLGAK